MPDDQPPPFEGLARWLGEDTEPDSTMPSAAATHTAPPRRRRIARGAALLAPWVIVLAVLAAAQLARLAPLDSQRPTEPSAQKHMAAVTPSEAPTMTPSEAPAVTGAPSGIAGDGHAIPAPAGVPAVAVRLVRDAVTGRHAGETTAIDVAVPEAPRSLGADQWLVRVHAVVLRGDARRWRSATHEVWAVPIGTRGEQVVGFEAPWPVATESPRVDRSRWTSEAVDEAAVRAVLRDAGLRPAGKFAAERHPELPHVIRVRVAGTGNRHVWLRTTPAMHVLGTRGSEAAE